jgi:hypothetical protein
MRTAETVLGPPISVPQMPRLPSLMLPRHFPGALSDSRLPPERNGHTMTAVMRRISPSGLAITPEAIP